MNPPGEDATSGEPPNGEILARFNHELRTQLADILGSAELLQHELPAGNVNVEQILKAGRNLLSLAEDLLQSDPAALAPSDARAEGFEVLYIEDTPANYVLVERILRQRPAIHITGAILGREGINLAKKHRPNLILLDMDLPDMHGSTVFEELRADPLTQNIPVVVISADAAATQIERLLAAGARNYLTKPFRVDRFLRTVDDILLGSGE